MNKDWLWKLQMDALESRAIGSDACRLLLLLCKRHNRNLCSQFPEPFKLSVADAAQMLGYSRESDKTGERAIRQLQAAGLLWKRSVTGSPPTTNYLILNSCQPTGIKSGQPTGNHISSSFQEEIEPNGSNSTKRGINGSLRSSETSGKLKAASPTRKKLTPAQLAEGLHGLSQLRRELERKTKTGAAFERKT